ncbi:hypothetical protein [Rhodoferax saidenbachensis]|uniref:hypothetical protein n=1 Tax=Rhodoferax saidenbachensis TaxID=1484693 RepID=UPI001268297C|nr:hypothetical protein [Rhodoferax saidenbachensis]
MKTDFGIAKTAIAAMVRYPADTEVKPNRVSLLQYARPFFGKELHQLKQEPPEFPVHTEWSRFLRRQLLPIRDHE